MTYLCVFVCKTVVKSPPQIAATADAAKDIPFYSNSKFFKKLRLSTRNLKYPNFLTPRHGYIIVRSNRAFVTYCTYIM